MCSFRFYFADVFSTSMWSDLRAAVPQGSSALQSLASSLPDVALASRAPSTSSKYFFLLQQMEILGTRTWPDSFSSFSVSLRYLSASFNDLGRRRHLP